MYVRVIQPNDQLLALLHLESNNPLARVIAPTATFFVPESDNLRPVHDVTMIGGAQPRDRRAGEQARIAGARAH